MEHERYPCISFLQVLGPILVILGHSANGLTVSAGWYAFTKEWIYLFHMPLFFLISGYLLAHRGYLHGRSYRTFVLEKSKRLLLPYLFWNLLFWAPKLLASAYIADAAPLSIPALLEDFAFPRRNIWGHTWFLVGLFELYLLCPVLERMFASRKRVTAALALALGVALYMLPIRSELLAFSDLHKDLLFFLLGCLLGQLETERFLALMKKLRWPMIALAAVSSAAALVFYDRLSALFWIPCGSILLALLSAGAALRRVPPRMERLAADSFTVYILHWPVMLGVRIVLRQLLGLSVPLTVAAMCAAGWLVPVAAAMLLRRLPLKRLRRPVKYLLGG